MTTRSACDGSGAVNGWRPVRGSARRWLGLALLALVAAYAATGFYVVNTDEQAVVRRFGALAARVGPGMHYRLPWPVDQVDVVKTTSVKKTGVGFDRPKASRRRWSGWSCLPATPTS